MLGKLEEQGFCLFAWSPQPPCLAFEIKGSLLEVKFTHTSIKKRVESLQWK